MVNHLSLDLHWDCACCKWDAPSAKLLSCTKEAKSSKMSGFTVSIKARTMEVTSSTLLLLPARPGIHCTVFAPAFPAFPSTDGLKGRFLLWKDEYLQERAFHLNMIWTTLRLKMVQFSVFLYVASFFFNYLLHSCKYAVLNNANGEVSWDDNCCYTSYLDVNILYSLRLKKLFTYRM